MKKTLSFALVLVMLLSALLLTSCDAVTNVLNNFLPQTTSSEEPARNTITKEEWVSNLSSSNFTFTRVFKSDTEQLTQIAKLTETAGEVKSIELNTEFYWMLLDGKVYCIEKDEETSDWVASQESREWFTLFDVLEMQEDYFDLYLKYNEESKSYVYAEEGIKVEFYFENGKLIKGSVENIELSLSLVVDNIGTTSVTLPEYTFAEQ